MLNLTGYPFAILIICNVVDHDHMAAIFCGIAATATAVSVTFTTR